MKKQKKKSLIIISLLFFIIAISIGGYFYFQYKELKKPIKENWGQKYYVYLKDVNENKRGEDAGLPNDLKKSELSFYEVKDVKQPVMVINYQKDKQDYSNVYYISDDKVNVIVYNQPSTVELLYNIENKKYDYYLHVKDKDTNRYKTIAQQINDRINELKDSKTIRPEEAEYSFKDDDVDKVTDVNGKEIILTKFDETFIKPDVKEKKIEYNFDLEEKELKSKITKQVVEYTPVEEIITKETQTEVEKKIEEVEKTKEEMTKAKEEVAKKEAEEKAIKEAEEKARQEAEGLKVGSYTLKYGRYEWDLAEVGDPGRKETFILRSDKTCTHTDYEGKTFSCTFKVGRATDGQSIESMVERDALIIKDNGGYERSYFPKTGGFRDTDLENFLYKGAN